MSDPCILIVDDLPNLRVSLRTILRHLNYTNVNEASNGEEALEQFERIRPDIVFIDIKMPVLHGLDAIKGITALDPQAFIVIVTGYSTEENVKEAMQSGVKGFLVKPFSQQQIQEIITRFEIENGKTGTTQKTSKKQMEQ
ncbi:MAG TPA: response regulator [Nitrospiria bacterium]